MANEGFDWPDISGVLDKVDEECDELKEAISSGSGDAIEEELGDLFFTLVNLARHLKIDPESSLRKANEKFEHRFRALETQVNASGKRIEDLSLESLEEYWQAVKAETSKS